MNSNEANFHRAALLSNARWSLTLAAETNAVAGLLGPDDIAPIDFCIFPVANRER